jgi:hypothetical protein
LLKEKKPASAIVEELYLTAFSRRPTAAELKRTLDYVGGLDDKKKALEDVLWVIVNSKEFMFNH